jgi:hypothetical protein
MKRPVKAAQTPSRGLTSNPPRVVQSNGEEGWQAV